MNLNHFKNAKNHPLLLVFFLCGTLFVGCSSLTDRRGGDDFKEQYREYQTYARAGYAAINKKEYTKAIEHYSKAIEMSPFVPSQYYYRGLAWYKTGNEDKAIEDFDKVIILDFRWSSAYIYRGLCRMKKDEYKEALSDYKSALKLKPNDASIHNNLSWFYATAKDKKFQDKGKALEHAKMAAELTKEKNAEILDTLARAYFINGNVNEAIETEKKALKLAPDNKKFNKNLKVYEETNSLGQEMGD